jgi:aldehyde dehydrogenase (NAD+)
MSGAPSPVQTVWRDLDQMRAYYEGGATRSYNFRRQQLIKLKQAIAGHEQAIAAALYSDLGKSPEESFGMETGLLLAEINMALKMLHSWMRPKKVKTNLLNLPSSSLIYPDPLGVVLIIAPWNYPFQLTMIPLVGALAAGNVAVLKPSELAPSTSTLIAGIISGIFEPEYVQVVQGDGSVVVPALMDAFRFDHVFYTGSITVGKAIYQRAASDLIPVTLELGGKSPVIVEEDAALAVAAKRIAFGKFTNAGQTCIAPDYLLVHEKVREQLLVHLQQAIFDFFGADPLASSSYGRIIHERRFDTLVHYLDLGRIIAGGHHNRDMRYIAPTLMDGVSPDSLLMKEEIFGPILPVFSFRDREEALAFVRKRPNPLAFYVFTSSEEKEKAWIRSLPFGNGCINNTNWQFGNPHLPFGGIGQSGMGAYHGKYSFDTFSHRKPVMKTPSWFDPAIKYPPFEGKLKWFKLFVR